MASAMSGNNYVEVTVDYFHRNVIPTMKCENCDSFMLEIFMFDNFENWWHEIGSGIIPSALAEDVEEHSKKVAFAAWIEMNERAVNVGLTEADRDVAQSIECLR